MIVPQWTRWSVSELFVDFKLIVTAQQQPQQIILRKLLLRIWVQNHVVIIHPYVMSSPVDRRDWGGTLWVRETETHQLGGSAVKKLSH